MAGNPDVGRTEPYGGDAARPGSGTPANEVARPGSDSPAEGDDIAPPTYPEHPGEYPDEQADDERILREVPPHY